MDDLLIFPPDISSTQQAGALLGGAEVLQHAINTPLDAHELLKDGLPSRALQHLLDNLVILKKTGPLERAVGMSLRTFQRHSHAPDKPLSPEQSGRTWKFAEILAKATALFGSREDAERWLDQPATGLDQRRPIDLLATPAGTGLVETFLERLEYGVYT